MIVCCHGYAIPERKAFIITLTSMSPEMEELWDEKDIYARDKMKRGLMNGF